MTFTHSLSTNNYGPFKLIVSSNASDGTHTTITSALAVASLGDTVYIRQGTYTENFTLPSGVGLAGLPFPGLRQTGVLIQGKVTINDGNTFITGISFNSNGDNILYFTGSSTITCEISDCSFTGTTQIAINDDNSAAGSRLLLHNCVFQQSGAVGKYTMSGAGTLGFYGCQYYAGSGGNTASTQSAGKVYFTGCTLASIISASGGTLTIAGSDLNLPINAVAVALTGTATATISNSIIGGGTSSAATVDTGATLNIFSSTLVSSNTNVVSGAGTFNYSNISFGGSSKIVTATTLTGGVAVGGVVQAPSAGFIGEQISSAVALSAVGLTSTVPANVTSISLTAGIWDVSGSIQFTPGATTTNTLTRCSISTVSATNGTAGNNMFQGSLAVGGQNDGVASVPQYRLTLTATTTVYLVADSTFAVSTLAAGGRITGTRVG